MDWLAEKQVLRLTATPEALCAGAYTLPADELRGELVTLEVESWVEGRPVRNRRNISAEMYREALLSVELRQFLGQMIARDMAEFIGSNA